MLSPAPHVSAPSFGRRQQLARRRSSVSVGRCDKVEHPLFNSPHPLSKENKTIVRQVFKREVSSLAGRPSVDQLVSQRPLLAGLETVHPLNSESAVNPLHKAQAELATANSQLVALMPTTRVLVYSSKLAGILKSAKAALFLSQLVYWTRVGEDVPTMNGWIHKTREAWTYETGLTRTEQETVRKLLIKAQVLEEVRCDRPARLYFRVNLPALADLMTRSTLTQGLDAPSAATPAGSDVPSAATPAGSDVPSAAQALWQARLRSNDRHTLLALLGNTQPFHFATAQYLKDTHASIVLSRMMWLQTRTLNFKPRQAPLSGHKFGNAAQLNPNPLEADLQSTTNRYSWFAYSARSFEADLGLSRSQVVSAIKTLLKQQWIKHQTLLKPAKHTLYQLCPAIIAQAILKQQAQSSSGSLSSGILGLLTRLDPIVNITPDSDSVAQNLPTRNRVTQSMDGRLSATQSAGFKQPVGGKPATLYRLLNKITNTTTALNASDSGGGTVNPLNSESAVNPLNSESAVNPLNSESAHFIYPSRLSEGERVAIELLIDRFIDSDGRQDGEGVFVLVQSVLDELAGAMKLSPQYTRGVYSPVGFVRKLLLLAGAGAFVPERAFTVQASRHAREQSQVAMAEKHSYEQNLTIRSSLDEQSSETRDLIRRLIRQPRNS